MFDHFQRYIGILTFDLKPSFYKNKTKLSFENSIRKLKATPKLSLVSLTIMFLLMLSYLRLTFVKDPFDTCELKCIGIHATISFE